MKFSSQGAKNIPSNVLDMLRSVTGIGDAEAWSNILSLVGKGEHDSLKWWLCEDGGSVYGYNASLSYDFRSRGRTIGLFGATTHHGGKPVGDAQELFAEFVKLGGEDLAPLSKDCAKDKDAGTTLCKKIEQIAADPRWILAQWNQLMSNGGSGYVYESMRICKKRGIEKPSALTIAALYDCSMNQGATGDEGSRKIAQKVAASIKDEKAFLAEFLAQRKPIAGTNAYNSPPVNGKNRVQQFIDLLEGGCMDLKDCDAQIEKATSWEMK